MISSFSVVPSPLALLMHFAIMLILVEFVAIIITYYDCDCNHDSLRRRLGIRTHAHIYVSMYRCDVVDVLKK